MGPIFKGRRKHNVAMLAMGYIGYVEAGLRKLIHVTQDMGHQFHIGVKNALADGTFESKISFFFSIFS